MKKYLIFLCLTFQFLACKKDSTKPSIIYQVPEEIEVYINSFIDEANNRGFSFKKENLIVEFTTVAQNDICGLCSQAQKNPAQSQRKITITKNESCWKNATEQTKEALVFHELGHCWLGRLTHKDDLLPNGSPASMMSSRNDSPYSVCVYDIGGNGDCNKLLRRKYYIDELFNEKTEVPSWAK